MKEITLRISDDYCQGNAGYLESLDPEEYEFPAEDTTKTKLRSIKVKRGKD